MHKPFKNSVRKGIVVGFAAFSAYVGFPVVACHAQDAALQGIKTPMWQASDLAKQPSAGITYQTTMQLQPPFFKGKMPLTFIAGKSPTGMSEMTTIYFQFDDFRNTFIYLDPTMRFSGIAEGAVAADRTGTVLAEARIMRMVAERGQQLQGLEIEEFHYDKGKLVFRCKSIIDFPMGVKEKESDVVGKKQRDYFFIWPVTSF